jgi:hypothetical protein
LLTKIIVKYYFGGFSTENKIFLFWRLFLAAENKETAKNSLFLAAFIGCQK